MDCHGAGKEFSFNSLVPELPSALPLGRGMTSDEYTAFLESGCDAALFVGMHAGGGSGRRHEPHVSGSEWQNLWFNDVLVGETGINAALCGTGLPGADGLGDQAACREARELLGVGLVTVQVKESYARRRRGCCRRVRGS